MIERPQVDIKSFNRVYFIGIGGIGMSALARYFKRQGLPVAGYDKTPSPLTHALSLEGINVHFEDRASDVIGVYRSNEDTLVVYTPAIPEEMGELSFFRNNGYVVLKRAQVLGLITRSSKALGVAGTHGKTTTSTMLAHIMNESELGCNAFLGGIATNFNSNFVSHESSPWTVIEADEFDRSFLQLTPFGTIITSTDADHLDIYGDTDVFLEGFKEYVKCIRKDGFSVSHIDVELDISSSKTYAVGRKADYQGGNLRFQDARFMFDVTLPDGVVWEAVELGIPGIHNAENAIACIAMVLELGLTEDLIRKALKSFKGVKRRFEYHVRKEDVVYIDDYAHHPTEIKALIDSVKLLYPNQKIIGVFQPHLYSRTRDFFDGFVEQLSRLDELILLPIYPARELPIEGVTSEKLLDQIDLKAKTLLSGNEVLGYFEDGVNGVVLTIGAGDIDRIVRGLTEKLTAE
ncbi:MAG: UDP-N-acetylmuramate--L-alanine ligase [Crocinitomicaceae bacterium]|nr:UDP-N-acetylmuramate--L-alanine ligase [Crocinitomicaceae bacterium]